MNNRPKRTSSGYTGQPTLCKSSKLKLWWKKHHTSVCLNRWVGIGTGLIFIFDAAKTDFFSFFLLFLLILNAHLSTSIMKNKEDVERNCKKKIFKSYG